MADSSGVIELRPTQSAMVQQRRVELTRSALLVCQDLDQIGNEWGGHWLEQQGFRVIRSDGRNVLDEIATNRPDVVIATIDARTYAGELVIRAIRQDPANLVTPLLAICATSADVDVALGLQATDVIRQPLDWQVISHRAALVSNSVDSLAQLEVARDALNNALKYAENARRTLAHQADTDALTGLPNRKKFVRQIDQALACEGRQAEEPMVLVISLERFHLINAAYGYHKGSQTIEQAARRLEQTLAQSNLFGSNDGRLLTATVGKLAGVRFGLLVNFASSPEDRVYIAKQIMENLGRPFVVDDRQLFITASIGVAVPTQQVSGEQLLHRAQSAMLDAKHRGTGISLFRESPGDDGMSEVELETRLREAVANQALSLAYQPLVDAESGEIIGAEALLRWNDSELGAISPSVFVPVAEASGLMTEIGDWIIETACRDLRDWSDAGQAPSRIAINLSLCQLLRGDVLSTVKMALRMYSIEPSALEFELSERGIVGGDPQVLAQLSGLRELGISLSIDDFGTGDAAISYLKTLPIDTIKIDGSYVWGAADSNKDAAIGIGVTSMAHRMGLRVVAEGVETPAQLSMVRQWGCEAYQGYLCSPAVDASSFADLLG